RDLRVMSPTSYQTAPPRGVTLNVARSAPSAVLIFLVERLRVVESERRGGVGSHGHGGAPEAVGVLVDHLGVVRGVGGLRLTKARLAEILFLRAWIRCFGHALTPTRRRVARTPPRGRVF